MYSPIREHEEEASPSGCGCGCFKLFSFTWKSKDYGDEETWLVKKLKKIKEVSELIAGPKWKNFVRKIGKYCNPNKRSKTHHEFQYDAQSYALNFDDGHVDADHGEEDGLLRTFSARFTAPINIHNNAR